MLNMNQYATKKTAAEGMLDIALFLANITHMKTVIEQGAGYRYSDVVLSKDLDHFLKNTANMYLLVIFVFHKTMTTGLKCLCTGQ